jgi:hypothetical protein
LFRPDQFLDLLEDLGAKKDFPTLHAYLDRNILKNEDAALVLLGVGNRLWFELASA